MREKLIELLQTSPADIMGNHGIGNMADHLIANGVTVQRWIPVTERLPEESGQYIVCCDDSWCSYGEGIWYRSGVIGCAEADVGVNGGICWEWSEGSSTYDLDGLVTHWMPLPDAPKEVAK